MKKLISLCLALVLALALCPGAFAADSPSLTYDLTCQVVGSSSKTSVLNGSINKITVQKDDIIQVTYSVSATSAVTVKSMQANIYYDTNYFSLVSGSVQVEDEAKYVASDGAQANGDRNVLVYFNFSANNRDGDTYSTTSKTIATFQLKALQTSGVSTIHADTRPQAYSGSSTDSLPITTQNLVVSFGQETAQTFTVTYNPNGGTMSGSTTATVESGKSVTLPTPTRSGYTFASWELELDNNRTQHAAGSSYTPTRNVTFKAIWSANAPAAPSVTGGTGVITGTTTAMEYSTTTDFTTTYPCSAGSTTVAAGTYYVRVAADQENGIPAGAYKAVTVTAAASLSGSGSDANLGGGGLGGGGGAGGGASETTTPDTTETPADDVTTTTGSFKDVASTSYYYDAVEWAVANGITTGTSATTFEPDVICTRAQAVTFLWRVSGSPAPASTDMPYTDVAANAYYHDAVLWAVENGITKGTSDTTFSPDMTCTRAHIATFLWRLQNEASATAEIPFVDVSADAYYAAAVQWAAENEITNGTSDTTFSPDHSCNRAQIVTFLYRMAGMTE